MIEFTTGDILSSDAEALVNTVNCVGIMGRGIALQFKNNFPENFKAYEAACARDEVKPGKMFVFETRMLTGPKYIVNFPTKRHWKGKSRIEDIDSGLKALAEEIRNRGILSIAVPPLGSGLGGLNWGDVRPRIVEALRGINDLRVIVYEPNSAPIDQVARSSEYDGWPRCACCSYASLSWRAYGPFCDADRIAKTNVLYARGWRTASAQLHQAPLRAVCRQFTTRPDKDRGAPCFRL